MRQRLRPAEPEDCHGAGSPSSGHKAGISSSRNSCQAWRGMCVSVLPPLLCSFQRGSLFTLHHIHPTPLRAALNRVWREGIYLPRESPCDSGPEEAPDASHLGRSGPTLPQTLKCLTTALKITFNILHTYGMTFPLMLQDIVKESQWNYNDVRPA